MWDPSGGLLPLATDRAGHAAKLYISHTLVSRLKHATHSISNKHFIGGICQTSLFDNSPAVIHSAPLSRSRIASTLLALALLSSNTYPSHSLASLRASSNPITRSPMHRT